MWKGYSPSSPTASAGPVAIAQTFAWVLIIYSIQFNSSYCMYKHTEAQKLQSQLCPALPMQACIHIDWELAGLGLAM